MEGNLIIELSLDDARWLAENYDDRHGHALAHVASACHKALAEVDHTDDQDRCACGHVHLTRRIHLGGGLYPACAECDCDTFHTSLSPGETYVGKWTETTS